MSSFGEVAERSIAADCKSAALVATEVRTLPSPPLDSPAARARWWQSRSPGESSGAVSERSESNGSEAVRRRGMGGSNSVVESQPSKLLVAGSIPVSRSNLRSRLDTYRELRLASQIRTADVSAEARSAKADVAQLAERVLGKDEVTSSILVIGSILRSPPAAGFGWQAGEPVTVAAQRRRWELRMASRERRRTSGEGWGSHLFKSEQIRT